MANMSDPRNIYNQLTSAEAGLAYVNGVIANAALELWELKEYCALQLDNIARIADLKIAIAVYEENYAGIES